MEKSGIDYVTHSWGPWRGCTKVAEGCLHCYAEREMNRWGLPFDKVTRAARASFDGIRSATKYPPDSVVFVCPWGDFLHEAADAWRPEAVALMEGRRDLTFVVPTKRLDRLPAVWRDPHPVADDPLSCNTILLASVSMQRNADQAIRHLLNAKHDWGFRVGLSVEPMVGPIVLEEPDLASIDWVVCGAESGGQARHINRQWVKDLRDACRTEGVPFYYKQGPDDDGRWTHRPVLDGRTWCETPW
jgi:protein gp37